MFSVLTQTECSLTDFQAAELKARSMNLVFSTGFRYRRLLADRRPDHDEDVAVSSTISPM